MLHGYIYKTSFVRNSKSEFKALIWILSFFLIKKWDVKKVTLERTCCQSSSFALTCHVHQLFQKREREEKTNRELVLTKHFPILN